MSRFPIERQMEIISLLQNQKTVKIENLSRIMNVSENTIRRDLKLLESKGTLKRIKGGAMLPDSFIQPFQIRNVEFKEEKALIGKGAAKLINEGDIIIIDAGTTTLYLAKNIEKRDITVLTNFVDIASEFYNNNREVKKLILSGGITRYSTHSLIGPPAESFFAQVNADKLFLGAGGLHLSKGLTNANMEEIPVKRAMINSAKQIILLADSSKFGKVLLSQICPLERLDCIITDHKVPLQIVDQLENMNIKVIIAENEYLI